MLDEFHIKKYLRKIVRERKGNKEETMEELCKIICTKTKKEFEIKGKEWEQEAASSKEEKRIEEGIRYILSNGTAAKLRLQQQERKLGSSTESHVSHVLSSRMSSRPMGRSEQGMKKMAGELFSREKSDFLIPIVNLHYHRKP